VVKLSDLSPAARAQAERLLGSRPKKPRQPADTSLEDAFAFQLRAAKLPAGVRQHRFMAPEREFQFDWCLPERLLAVEIDGGRWVNGAHVRGEHFHSDSVKYTEAALRGWRVMRFDESMIEDGSGVLYVERFLRAEFPRVLP
jgi:very-short-patch-repair endonuclease